MNVVYKRLLLKISGEQLTGQESSGIDPQLVAWIAGEIRQATAAGAEVVVMVGGGNFVRGAQIAGNGISPVTADNMGMLSTMINGLALADIFNAAKLPARVLTNIRADQVADQFTQRRAVNHLHKDRVVIVAGGIGRPYFTTDTAAVNLALELDRDVICKLTKVDGVYTKDPAQHSDAERYQHITFQQALENPDIRVMDKAALGLAMEHHKPIVVFNLLREGNIRKVAQGELIGTLIS